MQQSTSSPALRAAKPAKLKPPAPPPEFREGDIASMDVPALLAILRDPNSSEFQKAKACQRAGESGAEEAVPALAALLADEHLSTYARYGLEPIPGPSVDDALRSALPKLEGKLRIGVIHSIGKRRDAKAVVALARLVYESDARVASAASYALGQIGGLSSKKELETAMGKTTGVVRSAVADASLICAERLLAGGQRTEGLALYAMLSAPEMPKPARLAAMQGIIREETSTSRPR